MLGCAIFGLIILCLLLPFVGVIVMAGCTIDVIINLILCLMGYIPGYIHAFYLLHIWQDRRKQYLTGNPPKSRAPFVFSEKIQSGGSWGAAYRRNKNAEQTRLLKVRAAASPGVKADNAAQEKVGGKKAGVEEPAMVLLETLSPQQPAIRVEIDVAAARKK